MRDHFQTRSPEQKVRRMNDPCYVDTYVLPLLSVQGYTCWSLFCFRRTGLGIVYLMRRQSQTSTILLRMVADCGTPILLKSNIATEFKGIWWVGYLLSFSVQTEYTKAHHPKENIAELFWWCLEGSNNSSAKNPGLPFSILVLCTGVCVPFANGVGLIQSELVY